MANQSVSDESSKLNVIKILQYTVLVSAILYFGRMLFIPLGFSLLISCILYPLCSWMEKKKIGRSMAIALAMFSLFLFLSGIVYLLFLQIVSFSTEWVGLKIKLENTLDLFTIYLSSNLHISNSQQELWIKNIIDNSGAKIISFLSLTFYSLSVYAVLLILIPVLSSLILYHRRQFLASLYLLFPRVEKETVREIAHDVILTYYNFIKGMLVVYLVVGVLNSIGLAILGIPHPVLFGFMASILTFIPYVGIISASLLPISISWIEHNSFWYPMGVILIFTLVQYLESNIIFPMAVSSRLKINTLVTIVAIISGGILWGAAGMILFIPFLGILKLIADRTEGMKVFSMLIGTKGG